MPTKLVFLIFIALTGYCSGLKCFDCLDAEPPVTFLGKSAPTALCGLYDDSVLVECPANAQVCVITDTRIGALSAPIHGCGTTEDACGKMNGTTDVNGLKQTCNSCDSDKCNGRPDIGILRCFECSIAPASIQSKNVLSPCYNFNNSAVRPCPATSHVCVNMEIEDVDGTGYVYGCGTTEEECESVNGLTLSTGTKYTCESCTENKCNSGGPEISAHSLLTVTFLTIAAKFGLVLLNL